MKCTPDIPDFPKKIIFSGEVHFYLSEYLKNRIVVFETPRVIIKKPLYSQQTIQFVFCTVFRKRSWSDDYCQSTSLLDFIWFQMEAMDLHDIYYQQDNATCHTNRETIDFVACQTRTLDFTIWSPRSCDLTPLDFFL